MGYKEKVVRMWECGLMKDNDFEREMRGYWQATKTELEKS